jgi:hypothetical protein
MITAKEELLHAVGTFSEAEAELALERLGDLIRPDEPRPAAATPAALLGALALARQAVEAAYRAGRAAGQDELLR